MMNTYKYEDIVAGHKESFEFSISDKDMDDFRQITGDSNPLHNNEEYAKKEGYSGRVCYGMLTAAFLSTLAGVYLPGQRSLIHSVQINMLHPVYIDDLLICTGEVTHKNDAYKTIKVSFAISSKISGENVVSGNMRIGVADNSQ